LNSVTSPLANFGSVSIKNVVYDSSGALIAGLTLYNDLAGSSTTITTNSEYLDTTGWHDPTKMSLGTT